MSHPIASSSTSPPDPPHPIAEVAGRAPPDHYTFGDGAPAAERLALLAAVFEPSSARLLRPLGYLQPRQAVDLGCGLGWSTRLLHAMLAPARTLGLDRSPEQVARARLVAPPGIEYQVHEVTDVPFPGERPDLLYSRFLLTHLRDPQEALAGWARAAADRAVLVLEETADMVCDHPTFLRYYQLVAELQAAYGQRLRVGAALVGPFPGWTTEISLLSPLSLPATRMARLHALNLTTWRQDPYARAAFVSDELDQLAAQLTAIATGADRAPPVRVVLRQLVLGKP
jgi:trans-aconitate 2-methyltransferase